MPEGKISADTILIWLREAVEQKRPIAPFEWVDAAIKLNALKSEETELLHKMQQEVAQKKLELLKDSKSVAEVRLKIEATDEYKFMRDQLAKIAQIEEQIRLAKLQARINDDGFRNQ